MKNPAHKLLEWLPELDFGVMEHGFLPHGRDYYFIVEIGLGPNSGTYQIQFTHVVEMNIITNVADDIWPKSWGEEMIDYQAWEEAGEPDGYVWGTNWSNAYPGIEFDENSERAKNWGSRIEKPMHELTIVTDRFKLNLIFHDIWWQQLSKESNVVSKTMIPLSEPNA